METREIRVADLLLDEKNPRRNEDTSGQRDIVREIARLQGKKLVALAMDILENGLDPSELTITCPSNDREGLYVVLDGNRRLASLKLLENPELIKAAETKIYSRMSKLAEKYRIAPIDTVTCVVYENRDEARHWLELKHTGEVGGAGKVPWGGQETARFRSESSALEPHMQALNFLETKGLLSRERKSKVAVTTLGRLLQTPDVRERLGVEVVDGQLRALGDQDEVARALKHVTDQIADGSLTVGDVYRVEQRRRYANDLPESIAVDLIHNPGEGEILGQPSSSRKAKRPPRPRPRPPRSMLIPPDCFLDVADARTGQIEQELRTLRLEKSPNAVSVLLRVFLELSVDWHIDKFKVAVPGAGKRPELGTKLKAVADHLVSDGKLTKQAARPARRAAQKDSWANPSVTLMHDWVHNLKMFPSPIDLRSHWDSLQDLFEAIWSAPEN